MKSPIEYEFLNIDPFPERPKIDKDPHEKNRAPHVFKSVSKQIFSSEDGEKINAAYNRAIAENKKGSLDNILKNLF